MSLYSKNKQSKLFSKYNFRSPLIKWGLVAFSGILLFFVVSFMIVFLMTRIAFLQFFVALMPKAELKGVNILAIGIDETRYVQRSDTILVFHLDPVLKRIGVISIPRDTRVNVKDHGITKINHAYAFGGASLLKETVSSLLNVPIQYYVQVNLSGVSKIVDELGGVTIDVEKELLYRDMAAGLFIDVKKGEQVLNGDKVMQFLRYRHDSEGDIGRIRRQQQFMQSLAQKIIDSTGVVELPIMIRKLNKLVETDLKSSELISFTVQFAEAFRSGTVEKGTLPGDITMIDGISYWKPNIVKADQMIEYLVHGFDSDEIVVEKEEEPSAEVRRGITIEEVSRITEHSPIKEVLYIDPPLVVEVLNGMGRTGLGHQVAASLEEKNINIFNTGNAANFNYKKTLIVDWKGNLDRALYLATILKIDPSNIIVYDNPDKPLDVTLVIGHDWDTLMGNQ